MNKIFKVVWSKSKECYVVVSEVAKNNGGKKKVLASVLAGLAAVSGVGGQFITSVQAATDLSGGHVNVAPNGSNNTVGTNSIVVGFNNTTGSGAGSDGTTAIGAQNTVTNNAGVAVGNRNDVTGGAAVAVGTANHANSDAAIAIGNVTWANARSAIAIGDYVNNNGSSAGAYSTAIGQYTNANGENSAAYGSKASAKGDMSVGIGYQAKADSYRAVAVGTDTEAGDSSLAAGIGAKATGNWSVSLGQESKATGLSSIAIGDSAQTAQASSASNTGAPSLATSEGSIAIGRHAETNGDKALALGYNATVKYTMPGGTNEAATGGLAIGLNTTAGGGYSTAIGAQANTKGRFTTAVGYRASVDPGNNGSDYYSTINYGAYDNTDNAGYIDDVNNGRALNAGFVHDGNDSTAFPNSERRAGGLAIGSNAVSKSFGTAIGDLTHAENSGISIGEYSWATGSSSQAIGVGALANADFAHAYGRQASATGKGAISMGAVASAAGDGGVAMGTGSRASGTRAVAIGGIEGTAAAMGDVATAKNTQASGNESIAVGSNARATATNAAALGSNTEANIVGGVALGNNSKTTVNSGVAGFKYATTTSTAGATGTVGATRQYAGLAGTTETANAAAVSVGNGTTVTRQITSVAAGTQDTDAVNVAQLKNVGVSVAGTTGASSFLAHDGRLNIVGDGNRVSTVASDSGKNSQVKVNFDYDGLVQGGNGVNVTKTVDPDGKTVFTVDATSSTKLANGTNTTVTGDGSTATPYKVNVAGDLAGITSVTGNTGSGKITFTTPTAANGNVGTTINGGNLSLGDGTTNNRIVNLAPGVNGTDAVNVDQLNDAKYAFKTNAKADGGTLSGTATATEVAKNTTVTYAAGQNLTVKQNVNATTGEQIYTYSLNRDLDVDTVVINGKNGQDGAVGLKGADGVTRNISITTTGKDGLDGTPGANGTTRIVYDDGGNKQEVANLNDGLRFTGNNTGTENKQKLNSLVKVQGEGVSAAESATFTSASGNINVKADGTDTLTIQLNKNIKGLDSVQTKEVKLIDPNGGNDMSIKKDGDRITYTTDGGTTNKTVATTDDIWTIQANGTDIPANNGKVNVKAGDNVVITPDATNGAMTISAVTPVVYTDKNGNKVYKQPDGSFTKNADGTGGNVAAGDVIASFQDGNNTTTGGNMIVNNIGSAIKNAGNAGDSFLTRLDAANTATPNAAVNVSDLKSTSDALRSNELHIAPTVTNRANETVGGTASGNTITGAEAQAYKYNATTKQVELTFNDGNGNAVAGTKAVIDLSNLPTGGSMDSFNVKSSATTGTLDAASATTAAVIDNNKTVEFQAGKNLTIKQTNDTDGAKVEYSLNKDLEIETIKVTGPAGKDGSIGINGKDGVTRNITVEVPGQPGQPGTPGVDGTTTTRIVFDGKPQANLDDGLKFGGDMGTVAPVKLNKQVDVKGGITTAADLSTGKNIGVTSVPDAATGNATLNVQLAKNLTNLTSIAGDTNTGKITFQNPTDTGNNGDAVKISGGNVNVDGNKITNLAPGTNDSDAVNVKQLKDGERYITPGTYTVGDKTVNANAKDDDVTMTYTDGNGNIVKDATNNPITATISGVAKSDLSNITNDGVKKITGLGTIVKAGDNVTVTSTEDANTGRTTYTVNAITPAVYTDKQGNKVYKIVDPNTGAVTWNTQADGQGNTVNAGDIITSFENPNAPAGTTTTDGGMIVNNIGSAIKNAGNAGDSFLTRLDAANTATPNAAVNVSDLKSTSDALRANELHIRPTTTDINGEQAKATSYVYDANTKSVTLEYNDGTGANKAGTVAKIDLSGLANQITSGYTFSTNAKADGGTVEGTPAATAVDNGGTVTYAAGKNLTVKQDVDAANKEYTYTYSLSDDITVGKNGTNGVDGKIGVNGKDGSAVVINGKDGSIGLNGANGQNGISIKGDKGVDGVDGANGTNGITRIVYTDDQNNKREVATMDDGLRFTGNNTSTENKNKLNSLVTIKGEGTQEGTNAATGAKEIQNPDGTTFESATGNIAVEADGNSTLTVKLNKNVKGLDSVQTKEIKLIDPNGGNDASITYNGDRITYTTDGGTTNKTVATTDDIWKIQANGTTVQPVNGLVNVKAGDNVNITSDAATGSMTINAVTPAVYTTADGTKVYKVVDPVTGNTTWNTKADGSGTTVQPGDVITSFETPAGNTTGGTMIINNAGSAIKDHATPGVTTPTFLDKLDAAAGDNNTKNAVVNVTDLKSTADALTDKGLRFDANSGGEKTNKLGSKVTVQGTGAKADADYVTDNIKTIISQDTAGDTTINIGLAKDLTGVNSIANTVGGPTLTFGGNTINVTGGNLNMGGNKITNLAPATNDDEAVNYKQLKDSRTVVTSTDGSVTVTSTTAGDKTTYDLHVTPTAGTTSTWTAKSSAQDTTAGSEVGKHAGDASQVIADGKSVDFQAGKNIVVTQTNDGNGNTVINTALADNITAGKDGVNGVDGSIGATGKDGSSVVINGKDGSIGLTGPKGQDGKDGINGRNGANVSFTSAEGNQTLVNRDPAKSADTDKAARIVYVPQDANGNPIKDANGNNIVREVATMDDGLKFTGNNTSTENKAPMNSLVTIKGEGTQEGTNAATGAKEIQNPDGTTFESATGNIAVEADGNSTLTVKLNKNVKGLDSVQTKEIKLIDPNGGNDASIKYDGDRITYNNGGNNKTISTLDDELHITPTDFTAANDGTVTMTYTDGNGNVVTGKQATIKGLAINNDILLGADTAQTTTLKLNNAGGIRFNILGDASGTAGANQYINTRANGSDINVDLTQDAKDKLNKTYTVTGGANVTVTPTVNGDNTDFKIDVTATGGAASTWNVKSTGNTTADSETAAKTINDTNTVEMVAGNNLTVKQTSDATGAKVEFALSDNIRAGKDGVNGVDGSIGATGKDGNSVVLNGKDGTIGIDGKDGRPGVNGRDGASIDLTTAQGEQTLVNRDPNKAGDNDTAARIVYVPKDAAGNPIKDANGNNIVREVSTMDDGLRFTGNNTGTENKQKMNSLVKVQGEGVSAADSATFTSASGNINVKADGTDTLEIQLNKNLRNITSIQNGGNSGKITFNDPTTTNGNGVTISGGNVSVDGNKITNVQAGTDNHDAVNVEQMKANRTTVTSSDGSISVTDTNTDPTKGHAYDIKINNQRVVENAQTPVVYTNTAGDKVYKMGDGTFNTKADGSGTTVQPGDVIASMNNGNGSTTNPMVLNNVGSAINNQGGTTYLDKLNNANTATPNAAVNVSDLKNTADQLKADERHIAPGTYNVDNNGDVTMTYVDGNGNPVNGTAVISGIAKNDLSNITNDGKKVITGLGTIVKAGTNVTVNESTDPNNGQKTYTVNADLSGIAAKSQGIEIGQTGTGKAVDNNAGQNTVTKGTQFSAGNNITVTRDAVAGNNNIDHNITYALNSDLKDITSITGGNNSGSINFQDATANNGDGIKISGGNVNMGGNSITNLKPGTNKTDAATVGQMTQVTSNDQSVKIVESTNADGAKVYDLAVQGTGADPRIDHLSEEIGRVGAQGAALAALKPIQYDPLEPTQIMAGYGNYRGNSALALGVAHYKNESTMIHGGVSWAGGSSHMMANAGVTWKVGSRDSEAAVADRYRKGPISSAYTMQSEMAAMKAQNAGLKGEVADLKAENEQMKAQIAAMMAKLGL